MQLNFRQAASKTFLAVLSCALLLVLLPAIAFADEPPKNVLLFYSDDPTLPGTVLSTQAIRSTLKDKWKAPVQIFDEGRDGFRIPDEKYEAELVALLQRKYEGVHLDLIFAFSPPGLRFMLKHKAELFQDSPIVFIVNDQKRIADLKLVNTTGVSGMIEVAPTLELALRFQPQTERVIVAAGNAPLERDLMALAKKDFQRYEDKLAFTYLTDLTAEEMRQRLAVLPDKTIVIFLSFNMDRTGKAYVSTDLLPALAQSCSVPIYALNQTYFGNGIVGGRLLSYEAVGFRAAEIGVRILAGESAQNIPPQTVPSVTMVDWRQLRRWGIDESKVPAGSIVRFKQPTLWEQYKWRIIGVVALIIFQALLIIVLLINLARRRRAEEASIASEERYRNVVETQTELICRYLPDCTLTFVNDAYCRYFGINREQLIGTKFIQLLPEPARNGALSHIASLIENPRVETYELEVVLPNGETGWQQWTDYVIETKGHGLELQGIGSDISGRKRAEQEAAQRRSELAHLSRVTMLGELSSSLAHELNQPLGAILRNTEAAELFLQHPAPDLDELRAILADIRKDDQRAGAVIDRMRSMLKRRDVEYSLVDLKALVSEVISIVRSDAESRRVRLELEATSLLPPVSGDRVQLQQVLLNLLLNAMDAVNDCERGRRVVSVRVQPAGTRVEIVVKDTGHGIPTDKLAHLFEPFFTTKPNGLGMGLPISRMIMQAHGGSIRAENDPVAGAIFCLTLPMAKEENTV